jgi:hypothetical protein
LRGDVAGQRQEKEEQHRPQMSHPEANSPPAHCGRRDQAKGLGSG